MALHRQLTTSCNADLFVAATVQSIIPDLSYDVFLAL